MANEVLALVIGYLLGSIPSAYIVTRIVLGKDIRQLGGGNVGGLNTFREVGFLPGVVVAFFDLGPRENGLDDSRLFIAIHHLAVDGVSWGILCSDLELACAQLLREEPVSLPEIRLLLARRDDPVTDVLSELLAILGVSGVLLGAGAVGISRALARPFSQST